MPSFQIDKNDFTYDCGGSFDGSPSMVSVTKSGFTITAHQDGTVSLRGDVEDIKDLLSAANDHSQHMALQFFTGKVSGVSSVSNESVGNMCEARGNLYKALSRYCADVSEKIDKRRKARWGVV